MMKMIIYSVLGLGYGFLLMLLGFCCVWAGDGSCFPIWLFSGMIHSLNSLLMKVAALHLSVVIEQLIEIIVIFTFCLFPLIWGLVFFCLAKLNEKRWVYIFILLILLQYISSAYTYFYTPQEVFIRFYHLYNESSLYKLSFIVFAIGQLCIWGLFSYEMFISYKSSK